MFPEYYICKEFGDHFDEKWKQILDCLLSEQHWDLIVQSMIEEEYLQQSIDKMNDNIWKYFIEGTTPKGYKPKKIDRFSIDLNYECKPFTKEQFEYILKRYKKVEKNNFWDIVKRIDDK